MPDPLLVEDLPSHAVSEVASYETCWVLRGPVDENHEFIASRLKPQDIVVGLESKLDKPLKKIFPTMAFVQSLEDFESIICRSQKVVSMRFHGLILALRRRRPAYSVRMQKGTALLNMLGLGNYAFASARDIKFDREDDPDNIGSQINFFREIFRNSLLNMLSTLDLLEETNADSMLS